MEAFIQRIPLWEGLRHRFGLARAVLRYPGSFLGILQRIRKLGPDIVIVSQPTFTLPIQALLITRLLDARLVVDMQDIFVQFQEFYPNRHRRKLRLFLERAVLRRADRIVPVLPAMQELARATYHIPAERFNLMYNGFDSERYNFVSRGWGDRDIDLLHLGAPREYYSTESLIEAFEILSKHRPRTNLTFTDFLGTPYQASIRALVDRRGMNDRIRFLSRQPFPAILEMMTRAKLGVYTLYQRPSSRVVVGTKVFEYLAAGLPIAHLGPESGEMTRLIRENRSGFATSNPESWAALAHRALSERTVWEMMSQNARRAAPKFDWKTAVPRLCREALEPLGRRAA